MELVAADEDCKFRGERGDVFGRVLAIDQWDGGNRHTSNGARLWASYLQSRINLGHLFALCAIGKPVRQSVLAVR